MKRMLLVLVYILASASLLFGQNIIANGDFSGGTSPWGFWQNSNFGNFQVVAGAAKLSVTQAGSNVQFFQRNLRLEPNTRYKLMFKAYSSTGHDLEIILHKDVAPWTNFGVEYAVNLDNSWKSFELEFNTTGFSSAVNDGRIRFWMTSYAVAGDFYYFDDVVLVKYPHGALDTLQASADTYVRKDLNARLNDNYGRQHVFHLGTDRETRGNPDAERALIQFDFTGLPNPQNLVSARLELTCFLSTSEFSGSVFRANVYRVVSSGVRTPWIEGNGFETDAVFVPNLMPDCAGTDPAYGVAWIGAGEAGGDANNVSQPDVSPTVRASVDIPLAAATHGQVFGFDITTLVREWLSGASPNYGLLLRDPTGNPGYFREIVFGARDGKLRNVPDPRGVVNGPRLILNFGPNVVQNPTFDQGDANWYFWQKDRFKTIDVVNIGGRTNAAKLVVTIAGGNIQLFQRNLPLVSNSRYRLKFWAYSSSLHPFLVYVHKDGFDFQNYGLNGYRANLSNAWQEFTTEFNTTGFSGTVYDGRLRFWFGTYIGADTYYIDEVSLERIGPAVPKEGDSQSTIASSYQLDQNYPNPFNPTTSIRFQIPDDMHVSLKVFDVLGREVATLVDEVRDVGVYEQVFDAGNLASGMYFYRLQAGSFSDMKKLLLLR